MNQIRRRGDLFYNSEPDGGIKKQMDCRTGAMMCIRSSIYLIIMSSADYAETFHKLSKVLWGSDSLSECVSMLIECCSQEQTYVRYFGQLAQRFCSLSGQAREQFGVSFCRSVKQIHRYNISNLRNVARLYGHLFSSDSISWESFSLVRLSLRDTNASMRIFLKVLFQSISYNISVEWLRRRINARAFFNCFTTCFLRDEGTNVRFVINFFTSIGLHGLTYCQREYLRQLPQLVRFQAEG